MTTSSNNTKTSTGSPVLNQQVMGLRLTEVSKIEVVDTDIVVTTLKGKKIVVRDGALRSMLNTEFVLKFSDTEVKGQAILQNAMTFNVEAVAKLTGRNANVEPEVATPKSAKPDTDPGAQSEPTTTKPSTLAQQSQPEEPSPTPKKVNPEAAAVANESVAQTVEGQAAAQTVAVAAAKTEAVSASSGFFASLNPAWGALGALGALGAGGGSGGGDAVTTVVSGVTGQSSGGSTTKVVKAFLNIVLGEVNTALNYVIKSKTGEIIASGTTGVSDGGVYSLSFSTSYTGPVEVTISDPDLTDGKGYVDEASGTSKNLQTSVRALVNLTADGVNTINVTPLTELATRWAYDANGGNTSLENLTPSLLTQANTKVAKALNLVVDGTVVDITGVTGLNALNDSTAPSGPAATLYAQVLAALSGYDNKTQGSFANTLSELNTAILALPEGVDTNASTVGNILIKGATQAMNALVQSNTVTATSARDFLNSVYTTFYSSSNAGVASILFDSVNPWLQKGNNTFLLNFTKAQTANNILDYLTIDGVSAKTYGITSSDLKLVSGTTTSSSNNRQWVLTLNGNLSSVQSDSDKSITLKYVSTGMSSSDLTLEVGAIDPVVKSSGILGSRGTLTPTYYVEAQAGLTKVTVTLIDGENQQHIYTLKSSTSKPSTYTYTVDSSEPFPPGQVTATITLEDKYGNVNKNLPGTSFKLVAAPTFSLLSTDDSGFITSYDSQGNPIYDPTSLTDLRTKKSAFTYVVNTFDGAKVYVKLNNGSPFLAKAVDGSPGRYEVSFENVQDGQYSPTVTIVDTLTNASEEHTGLAVVVDSQGPLLSTSLATFNEVLDGSSVTITLPAQDTAAPTLQSTKDIKFWDALSGPDASFFSWVNGTHKKLTFTPINYEDKPSYSIKLTAYDDVGNATTQTYTVKVNNVNEQPTVDLPIVSELKEDDATGTAGVVTIDLFQGIKDPDLALAQNDTLTLDLSEATYTLNGKAINSLPQGVFDVSASTHQLKVNTSHSSLQSMRATDVVTYTLSYKVKDSGGLWVNQTATVEITGQDDPTVGTLVVNGTNKEGLTLSADVSGFTDAEGALSWTYQWFWKNAGNWEAIGSTPTTSPSLLVQKGWAGRVLKVVATAVDPGQVATPFEAVLPAVLANDLPVVTLSSVATGQEPKFTEGGQAVGADVGLVLSDANGTVLSAAKVVIQDLRAGDELGFTANAQSGVTGTYDASTGTLSFEGKASLSVYQNLLRSVTYRNTGDDPAGHKDALAGNVTDQTTRTLSWTVTDELGDDSASKSSKVNVSPVNDLPTLVAQATTSTELTEDAQVNVASVSYTLADADGTVSVDKTSMTSTAGGWTLSANGNELTQSGQYGKASYNLTTNVLTYTLDNTKPATQALTASSHVSESFLVQIKDDQSGTASQAAQFTINGTRDPLVLSLPVNALSFTELVGSDNGGAAVSFSGLKALITGDDLLQKMTLQWTPLAGDQLLQGTQVLTLGTTTTKINGQDVSFAVSSLGSGVLQLDISGVGLSKQDFYDALQSLKFNNSSDTPPTTDRTMTLSVYGTDGTTSANPSTQTFKITVQSTDDPTLGTLVVNGTNKEGLTLSADVSSFSDRDGTLSWTYQWYLNKGIAWEAIGSTPTTSPSLLVQKGWAGFNLKLIATAVDPTQKSTVFESVLASSVLSNDLPVVTLSTVATGQEPKFTEGGQAVGADVGLVLSDANGTVLSAAKVVIQDLRAGDELGFTANAQSGVTGTYDASTGTLSFEGKASLSVYQNLLRSVTYRNTGDDPAGHKDALAGNVTDQTTRTLSWTVTDELGDDSASKSSKVNVSPVNDLPTLVAQATTSTELTEDAQDNIASVSYTLADADGTVSVDKTSMTSTAGGWTLSANGNELTQSGQYGKASYNLTTNVLTYTLDNTKPATQALTVNDQKTESFTISAVDDLGAKANTPVSFTVNGAYDPLEFSFTKSDTLAFTEVSGPDDGTAAISLAQLGVDFKGDDQINALDVSWKLSAGDQLRLGNQVLSDGLNGLKVNGKALSVSVSLNAQQETVFSISGSNGQTLSRQDYLDLLAQLKFNNTSDQPSTAARTVKLSFQTNADVGVTRPSQSFSVSVSGTNDRPLVDPLMVVALTAITTTNAGAATPTGKVGNTVKELMTFASDADANAKTGLAITGFNNLGELWYSTDKGSRWTQLTSVSATQALLLSGEDDNARLYFRATGLTPGNLSDAFTVKAWDQTDLKTSGSTGVDTTASTAYSVATKNLSIELKTAMNNQTAERFASSNPSNQSSGVYMLGQGINLTVAMADFNGDGQLDLYIPWAKTSQADYLYLSQVQSGQTVSETFSAQEVAEGNVGAANSYTNLYFDQVTPRAALVDFNNDGLMDIALVSGNTNVSLLLNLDNQKFVNVAWATELAKSLTLFTKANLLASNTTAGKGDERILFADFNGDGFVDATTVYAGAGRPSFLNNLGNGRFDTLNAWQQNTYLSSIGHGPILWGDFTGDGILDFFLGSEITTSSPYMSILTGSSTGYVTSTNTNSNLVRTQGGGSGVYNQLINPLTLGFSATSTWDVISTMKVSSQSATAADFDQDGQLDLFLGAGAMSTSNSNTATLGMLLRNNPTPANFAGFNTSASNANKIKDTWLFDRFQTSSDITEPDLHGNVITAAWMDYNMDGWLDLITSEEGKGIYVYLNKGKSQGVFQGFASGLSADYTGLNLGSAVAQGFNVGDVDGDGSLDLVVSTDKGVALFLNGQTQTPKLSFKVLGTKGSTPLYGAKVTLTQTDDSTVTYTQFVQGDTGEGVNQGETVFYGLDATKTYKVKVEAAFDSDNTPNSYSGNVDTGIKLVKVAAEFAPTNASGYSPGLSTVELRVNPADPNQVTANRFNVWNPTVTTSQADANALTLNNGTDGNDTFSVDPKGAQVYAAGKGKDVLKLDDAIISNAVITLLRKDATGVAGYMGFKVSSDTTTPKYSGTDNSGLDTVTSTSAYNSTLIKGGIDFSGIDEIQMSSTGDVVYDNAGLSGLNLGAGDDRLVISNELLQTNPSTLFYDGGVGTDTFDMSGINLGDQILYVSWTDDVNNVSAGKINVSGAPLSSASPWVTASNFEFFFRANGKGIYDYRGKTLSTANIYPNGSDDVWYGTVGTSTLIRDVFYVSNSSKFSQNVTFYNGGVDATFATGSGNVVAGNDALYLVQSSAYVSLTAQSSANNAPKFVINSDSAALGGGGWFTGTMDDVYEIVASNYISAKIDLSALDHAVKAGLQTNNLDAQTNTPLGRAISSSLITTKFADSIFVGNYQQGSGNDTVEAGQGNDAISINAGAVTNNVPPVNGKTTLVFGKYDASNALYGNGSDKVTGFTLGNFDAIADTGEDALDLRAFGLSGVTDLGKYFKVVKTSNTNLDIRFDATGQGSSTTFNDTTNTLLKLSAPIFSGTTTVANLTQTQIDSMLTNLKTAGLFIL